MSEQPSHHCQQQAICPTRLLEYRHLFFGFDSETVIGDGFTRFANPVSVSLVKQAVSLKPKVEPVSGFDKWITPSVEW